VPEDATVDSVVQRLGIPGDATRVVLVNGRDADPEQRLAAGDTVAIFPPLMGGGAR
jgi:molybdopterin converting factor small subunit